jgi:nitrite reductase (NADH) small subunit
MGRAGAPRTPHFEMNNFIPVSTLSALREGQGITVFAAGRNVALFKIDDEVLALDGVCPHKGAPLGLGWCENGVVACPMHGWRFDIRTGDCLDVPNRPATTLPVRINGETIEVAL